MFFSDEIKILKTDLRSSKEKLNRTVDVVNSTASLVNEVYNDTWAIYSDVYDLMLPTTNAQDLKDMSIATAAEVRLG